MVQAMTIAAAAEVDIEAPPAKRARKVKATVVSVASPNGAASVAIATAEADPATPISDKKKKKSGRPAASPSELVQSNLAELQEKAQRIAEQLAALYPDPPIPLEHSSTFQLLCAVLLSAQTTDKKVNECTPALFKLAPDAIAMAAADTADIEACIRTLGLAPTKARNLKAMAQMLVEQHGGEVPCCMESLEALPGVGHKTASVVMCQAFGKDAMPVDTHIHRLAQRWGLTSGKSVEQTEADLKALVPQRLWKDLHLQVIFFGREQCPAQRHDPQLCPICSWAAVPPYNAAGVSPPKAGKKGARIVGKAAVASRSKAAAVAIEGAAPAKRTLKRMVK